MMTGCNGISVGTDWNEVGLANSLKIECLALPDVPSCYPGPANMLSFSGCLGVIIIAAHFAAQVGSDRRQATDASLKLIIG